MFTSRVEELMFGLCSNRWIIASCHPFASKKCDEIEMMFALNFKSDDRNSLKVVFHQLLFRMSNEKCKRKQNSKNLRPS